MFKVLKEFGVLLLVVYTSISVAQTETEQKQAEKPIKAENVVILGGGVSGLSSGIYLARSGLKPIIVAGQQSSTISQADVVENWPSEKQISGSRLVEKLKEQALASGCTILEKEATFVDFSKRPFTIQIKGFWDSSGKTILTNNCLIAMGCESKHLYVPGEQEYANKGVSYCALCDGSLYKDKVVAVVGGSKSAVLESSFLANLAQKIYVLVRGEDFRPTVEPKQKQALLAKDNVQVLYQTAIKQILGDGQHLNSLLLNNGEKLKVDGVFVAIGLKPNTKLFEKKLELDETGFIKVDESQKTSVEGVFAAGDITAYPIKQAILASASGVKAALSIEHGCFLEKVHMLADKNQTEKNIKIEQKNELAEKNKNIITPLELKGENSNLQRVQKDNYLRENNVRASITKESLGCKENKLNKLNTVSDIKDQNVQVVEIKSRGQLEKELSQSSLPIIVDFYATWCGPCKKIAPLLETLPASKVKVLKVNVDSCLDLAREYKIMAMPTAILFSSTGEVLATKIGVGEIDSLIKEFSH